MLRRPRETGKRVVRDGERDQRLRERLLARIEQRGESRSIEAERRVLRAGTTRRENP
jgi:hypothetical protein